jgi:hypothetical protein
MSNNDRFCNHAQAWAAEVQSEEMESERKGT